MDLVVDAKLVRRQHHPLNAGLRPSEMTGLENGRYSPSDRITPILDSMHMCFLKTEAHRAPLSEDAARKLELDAEEEQKTQHPMTFTVSAESDGASEGPRANCVCVSKNPSLLVPSVDGDSMVCALCGTCGEKITVSQHREKACAAEEDKTQHAEVPKEQWDRFAKEAHSLKAARQNKSGPGTRSVIKKNRKTLGFAPERVERLATKAQDARNELNAKAQSQELQLLVRLEKLFANLEPMTDSMKRYMRVETYCFFHTFVKHSTVCKEACCRFTGLRGRNLQYLATTCVAATLEQVQDGSCSVDVEKEQLDAIFERHRELDAPPALRTGVRELRLFLEKANAEEDMPPCEQDAPTVESELAVEDEKNRNAFEEAEKEGGAFGRQMRTFLRKLHFVDGNGLVAHTIEFYVGKYERIKEVVEASTLSWPAKAFAAMEVAARAKEGSGRKSRSPRMRPSLLASLGATEDKVVEFVEKLYVALG